MTTSMRAGYFWRPRVSWVAEKVDHLPLDAAPFKVEANLRRSRLKLAKCKRVGALEKDLVRIGPLNGRGASQVLNRFNQERGKGLPGPSGLPDSKIPGRCGSEWEPEQHKLFWVDQ